MYSLAYFFSFDSFGMQVTSTPMFVTILPLHGLFSTNYMCVSVTLNSMSMCACTGIGKYNIQLRVVN